MEESFGSSDRDVKVHDPCHLAKACAAMSVYLVEVVNVSEVIATNS
jgi:hypothetical protein